MSYVKPRRLGERYTHIRAPGQGAEWHIPKGEEIDTNTLGVGAGVG